MIKSNTIKNQQPHILSKLHALLPKAVGAADIKKITELIKYSKTNRDREDKKRTPTFTV